MLLSLLLLLCSVPFARGVTPTMARSFRTAAPGSGMHTASLLLLASSIQPRHFAHGLPCARWALPSREFVVDDHGGRFPAMTWDVVRGRTLVFHGASPGPGPPPLLGWSLWGPACWGGTVLPGAFVSLYIAHDVVPGLVWVWVAPSPASGSRLLLAGSFSCAAGACCPSGAPNVSARLGMPSGLRFGRGPRHCACE